MPTDDDLLNAFVAVRYGEVDRLKALLVEHPDLIAWQLGVPGRGRRPLHVVTDWPGYFPNGPEVAQILIDAGAEIDYRGPEGTGETALHWAASSDDADVAAVLIEQSPQADVDQAFWHACAGGQRRAAELLLARGADLSFTPEYGSGTVVDVATGPATQQTNLIEWLQELRRAAHSPD
jgi:hypothetical protein